MEGTDLRGCTRRLQQVGAVEVALYIREEEGIVWCLPKCLGEDDDTLAAAAAAVLCWCHNATRILDRGLHYLCVVPVALFVLRRRSG